MFREASLQAHFDLHGFVLVELLGERELRTLRSAWERDDGGLRQRAFALSSTSPDAAYRRHVHELTVSVFTPALERYIDRYELFVGLFINKARALLEGLVELHQDWTLVDESRHQAINIWCPLVDVDVMNGCLFLAPGSHRLHARPRAANAKGKRWALPPKRLMPAVSPYVRPYPMRAGQAMIFTNQLYHGSGPNLRDASRPVATCVGIPRGAQPRIYLEVEEHGREAFDVYEGSLDLLLDYNFNPGIFQQTRLIGRIPYEPTRLTRKDIRAVLEAGRVT